MQPRVMLYDHLGQIVCIVFLMIFSFETEIKAVAALLGVSGVSLYRGLTTKTKNVRGQILRSLCDSHTVSYNQNIAFSEKSMI